eukprot:scaffold55405_cov68-Phaeocystis_antarctica.AAC.4
MRADDAFGVEGGAGRAVKGAGGREVSGGGVVEEREEKVVDDVVREKHRIHSPGGRVFDYLNAMHRRERAVFLHHAVGASDALVHGCKVEIVLSVFLVVVVLMRVVAVLCAATGSELALDGAPHLRIANFGWIFEETVAKQVWPAARRAVSEDERARRARLGALLGRVLPAAVRAVPRCTESRVAVATLSGAVVVVVAALPAVVVVLLVELHCDDLGL